MGKVFKSVAWVIVCILSAPCFAGTKPRHVETQSTKANYSTVLPQGNAAWVYPFISRAKAKAEPAMWAPAIEKYNSNASTEHQISIIYSYGGDFEYEEGSEEPFQIYFTPESKKAAEIYKSIKGVKSVIAVVDGRMDGGDPSSPDLTRFSNSEIEHWADLTANTYCTSDEIDGLQVDLEPFAPPYRDKLLVLLNRLSFDLRLTSNNCMNSNYPEGRSLSAFMFAESATAEVFKALGPNGYVTVSGYDLSKEPAGVIISPEVYASRLTEDLKTIKAQAVASNGFFVIGIPAAASTHEFTQYIKADGTVIAGYSMLTYVTAALKASYSLLDKNQGWLGTALWGFSERMAFPNRSNNLYFPNMPFLDEEVEKYLQQNL